VRGVASFSISESFCIVSDMLWRWLGFGLGKEDEGREKGEKTTQPPPLFQKPAPPGRISALHSQNSQEGHADVEDKNLDKDSPFSHQTCQEVDRSMNDIDGRI
jgi:hypothetical protein